MRLNRIQVVSCKGPKPSKIIRSRCQILMVVSKSNFCYNTKVTWRRYTRRDRRDIPKVRLGISDQSPCQDAAVYFWSACSEPNLKLLERRFSFLYRWQWVAGLLTGIFQNLSSLSTAGTDPSHWYDSCRIQCKMHWQPPRRRIRYFKSCISHFLHWIQIYYHSRTFMRLLWSPTLYFTICMWIVGQIYAWSHIFHRICFESWNFQLKGYL